MESSSDLPLHWTPPTPYVVTTIPDYFGGWPTPPLSPFRLRDTPVFDDCAPCPPTPRFVPYDEEDGQWSTTRGPEILSKPTSPVRLPVPRKPAAMASQTGASEPTLPNRPPNDWRIPNSVHSTTFTDFVTNDMVHESNNRLPHVSDDLIYDFETYARPCPVLMIVERAILDQRGDQERPIDLSTCTEPFKMFSFTAGHPPKTGLDGHDQQTIKYYAKELVPCPLPEHEFSLSYSYPISIIETVRESLHTQWPLVYPSPIPVLIVRIADLVGFYCLRQRRDGHSFIMSSEDSIWPIVLQRGIGSDFRPLDQSRTVETSTCLMGVAAYQPQHTVASKFAVNLFLETVSDPGQGPPRCEYLGAYILQTLQQAPPDHRIWEGVSLDDRLAMCHRLLEFFGPDLPFLPMVQFLYYKWDRQILGLAEEIVQSRLPKVPLWDHTDSSSRKSCRKYPGQHDFMSVLNFRKRA